MTVCQLTDKLCRLMSPDLPVTIEPERLARKGEIVVGQYAIHEMQRLVSLLHDQSGQVIFRLEFSYDEDKKISYIMGEIHAEMTMKCQRCLDGMEFATDNKVYLGILDNQEDESLLPDGCDPLNSGNEPIKLSSLIEDEIILALPISVMHEESKCTATEILSDINNITKESPFSVLKNMSEKSRK